VGRAISTPRHFPVAGDSSPAEFIAAFDALAQCVADSVSLAGVAVAILNPFDCDRGISYMRHKYQQLYGTDLRQGLAGRLKVDPACIHFLNDAAAFLTGELYQGAATGGRAIGITLGTGVGSAFAVDGKVERIGHRFKRTGFLYRSGGRQERRGSNRYREESKRARRAAFRERAKSSLRGSSEFLKALS